MHTQSLTHSSILTRTHRQKKSNKFDTSGVNVKVMNRRRPWERHIPDAALEPYDWGPTYSRPTVTNMTAFREGGSPPYADPVVDAAVGRGHVLALTRAGKCMVCIGDGREHSTVLLHCQ